MEKIPFSEAVKMLDTGYYLMHLNYLLGQSPEIYRQNRDCSHFLVQEGRDWRNPNNRIVLVIADAEAEQKYLGSRAGQKSMASKIGLTRNSSSRTNCSRKPSSSFYTNLPVLSVPYGMGRRTLNTGRVSVQKSVGIANTLIRFQRQASVS